MESESIDDVLALLEERPTDSAPFQKLGQLYMKAGRLEEAQQVYERLLDLDPKDPFTHLFLANCFSARKMYPEALARSQCAAELLPDEAVAYWCQGDIYKAQGQYRLAQEAYERAVRVAPENEQAHDKLAAWHDFRRGNKGQTEEMISLAFRNDQAATTVVLASRWLETHPDDLWVIHKYAEMLYKMTRYEEAIRVYLDAIEQFEEWRWGIYNQLGHLYRYRGDLKIAEEWYQKAIDEDPDEGASYVFLGACQARQGKLSQAEETHRRATLCPNGQIDEAHHNLGLVLRGQGRLAEAADSFRKAIEFTPEYAEAIEALQDVEAALVLTTGENG